MAVKRAERGWGGHFCGASNCRFRRNTLLSKDGRYIVVSTVGAYYPERIDSRGPEEIGRDRHYETMAFRGDPDNPYHDAMVDCEVAFSGGAALGMTRENEKTIDLFADAMHERAVKEIARNFDAAWESGESWRKRYPGDAEDEHD